MFFTTEDTNRLYNKSLTEFTEGRAQRGLKILEKDVYLLILYIISRNNVKINSNDKI